MTWFLIFVVTGAYIGPLPENQCRAGAAAIGAAVSCQQPDYMFACEADGRPGTYRACPHFPEPPHVTVKEPR